MRKGTGKRVLALLTAVLACAALLGGCSAKPKTVYKDLDYGFQLEKPAAGEKIAIMHTSMGDIFIRLFREGQLDDVYVVYTEMVTPMRLEPRVQKLLPLDIDAFPWEPRPSEHGPYHQMVQYVPSADRVLEHLVPGYVKGELFGALVESFCAEQNARMTAMDSATDNARDMLKSLSLRYNRARQSAITQEITEIVGGTQGSAAETPQPRRPIPTRTVRFLADGRRA